MIAAPVVETRRRIQAVPVAHQAEAARERRPGRGGVLNLRQVLPKDLPRAGKVFRARLGDSIALALRTRAEVLVTAEPGSSKALHLAGALQLVGYRHVLASMWSIFDNAALTMADVFYAHLLAADPNGPGPGGQPQAVRSPYALHRAVARLREDHPTQPRFWVPYIHFGP
jgi:CHAT domain